MGIGPLLRNIAAEMNKKQDTTKKEDTAKAAQTGVLSSKKEMANLSSQFNTMINVLKDIRNIGMIQLRSDQQRLLEARRQSFLNKETSEEQGSVLRGGISATAGMTGKGGGSSIFGTILKNLPDILKLGLAGGAAYAIWNEIFTDKGRDKIKEMIFGKPGASGEQQSLLGSLSSLWMSALKAAPATTLIATAALGMVTGVFNLIGTAVKLALGGAKIAATLTSQVTSAIYGMGSTVGRAAGTSTATAAAAAAVKPTPAATGTAGVAGAASAVSTAGMTPAEKLKYNRELRAEKLANNQETARLEAESKRIEAERVKEANKKALATKAIGAVGKATLGLGSVASGIAAYENFEEGKTVTGTLNSISATLGTGALVSSVIPGGQVPAAIMAGISGLAAVGGLVSSYFEEGKPKSQAQSSDVQSPAPSAAQPIHQTMGNDEFFEKYKEMVGYVESRGNYGIEHKTLGYLGKYMFGVAALESVGYLKPGSSKKVGSKEDQRIVLDNPSNWTNGYSKEIFLSNPKIQDEALRRMTEMNLRILKREGVITASTSQQDIAGMLTAAHLGGPGGVRDLIKSGRDEADLNGTTISKYLRYGRNVFASGGSDFAAAFKAAGAAAAGGGGSITPNTIAGKDNTNATELSNITDIVSSLAKMLTPAGAFNMIDQSNKTNVTNNGGGGTSKATVDDNIRSLVNGLVY